MAVTRDPVHHNTNERTKHSAGYYAQLLRAPSRPDTHLYHTSRFIQLTISGEHFLGRHSLRRPGWLSTLFGQKNGARSARTIHWVVLPVSSMEQVQQAAGVAGVRCTVSGAR